MKISHKMANEMLILTA